MNGQIHTPIHNHLNYFPFNKTQEDFTFTLLEIADSFFPGFNLFNNVFAAKKAKNVIIDLDVIAEADYFCIFFDGNDTGIS